MAYRNKVFVSFDGDNDIHYYRLMCAWKQNDRTPFNFHDAHDITQARDTSREESIKRSLLLRLNNSKVFVLLIGEETRYLRKFVLWEMEQALRLELPIIGVNLNGLRARDDERCPPTIRDALALYVSFNAKILQHALEQWPVAHAALKAEGKAGPYYFGEPVYRQLGL
ncbi:MAG: molecular chaperone Tir [Actinobacteria bacterium RBG_16_64_13]|nr:MAG: molecular chaperone Tir [Actinobacteria bacterium RBG_16_64_13]